MAAGSVHHSTLEAETTTTVVVDVENKEDFFALRLLNSVQSLQQLSFLGLTREVFVFGRLQVRLRGRI